MSLATRTKCTVCGMGPVATIDSRHDGEWRYRRRRCTSCGHRWGTYEVPAELMANLRDCRNEVMSLSASIRKLHDMMEGVPLNGRVTSEQIVDDSACAA